MSQSSEWVGETTQNEVREALVLASRYFPYDDDFGTPKDAVKALVDALLQARRDLALLEDFLREKGDDALRTHRGRQVDVRWNGSGVGSVHVEGESRAVAIVRTNIGWIDLYKTTPDGEQLVQRRRTSDLSPYERRVGAERMVREALFDGLIAPGL